MKALMTESLAGLRSRAQGCAGCSGRGGTEERHDVLGKKRCAGFAYARPRHARPRQDELVLAVGVGEVARVDRRSGRWVVCFAPGRMDGGGVVGAGAHQVGARDGYTTTYGHKQGHGMECARKNVAAPFAERVAARGQPKQSHIDAIVMERNHVRHGVLWAFGRGIAF